MTLVKNSMNRQQHNIRTDALKVAHETAAGLFRAGFIDKATMRRFDALCLKAERR